MQDCVPAVAFQGLDAGVPVTRTVTFVVPAFNEQENIADTVVEIEAAACGLDDYEIVIVNDCSTDGTAEVIEKLAQTNGRIRTVHNARNLGLGGAYKAGAARATMAYVIMIPGDNNHPANGIIPVLESLGVADIVIPYVTNPQVRQLHRRIISDAFRRVLNFLFRLKVPYYNGLVVHRTELLRTITIETDSFAYQAEALVKLLRMGASSVAVPLEVSERGDHRTRAFKPKNIYAVCLTIWRLSRTKVVRSPSLVVRDQQ